MARIRIGISGAGSRGILCFVQLFVQQFGERSRLVALADPNEERARAGLSHLGVRAEVHKDFHDIGAGMKVAAKFLRQGIWTNPRGCT